MDRQLKGESWYLLWQDSNLSLRQLLVVDGIVVCTLFFLLIFKVHENGCERCSLRVRASTPSFAVDHSIERQQRTEQERQNVYVRNRV